MTNAELDEIEARANAATKGPWFVGQAVPGLESVSRPDRRNIYCGDCSDVTSAAANIRIEDAEFIAHARSDVPKLLAEVRRLQEMLKAKIVAEFLPAIKQVDAAFEAEARRFMDRLSPPPPPAPHRT